MKTYMPTVPNSITSFYGCIKAGVNIRKGVTTHFIKSTPGYKKFLKDKQRESVQRLKDAHALFSQPVEKILAQAGV